MQHCCLTIVIQVTMNKIFPRIIRYLLIVVLISFYFNSTAQTIWSEDFSSYTDPSGIDNNSNVGDYPSSVSKWTLDISNCNMSKKEDHFYVTNNEFEARSPKGEAVWTSETINISSYPIVSIMLEATEDGNLEADDYIEVYYKLDGGSEVLFGSNYNDFTSATYTISGLSGNTLNIIVKVDNDKKDEYIRFDNIVVENYVKSDYFYYVSDADDNLYTINRNTGACSNIGPNGVSNIEAIANWPARNNQRLYAADGGNLGWLSTSTGAFTLIGDVDADGPAQGSEGAQALNDIDGLTFDPRTKTLWGSQRRAGTYDLLFQIDFNTGKVVRDAFGSGVDYIVIAGSGVYEDFDDMAVSPADGTLYGVSNNGSQDQILSINKTNGAVSVVSSLSSIADVEGLAFSNDNHMYGTSGNANDFAEIFWSTGASNTISSNMCGGGDPENLAALVEDANYIEGRVYHDDNQNQVDDSETGLSGVVVELYYDVNGNGAVDAGDEFLTTATTDGNGDYYFDYASVGDLVMQIDLTTLPSGYALTTNNVEVASFASQDNADIGNDFGADTGSDCDGNGIPDFTEGTADSDGDGKQDQCDLDNDNDGILDSEEGTGDLDGDGIPNYLDLDSDNDGIPDAIEANGGSAPSGYSSSTGRISGSDSDSDGLLDVVDNAPYVQYGAGSTSTLPRGDHDGDGYADYEDKDSDNDGILDVLEAGGTDSNGDGEVDGFTDSNSDGYYDALTSSPLSIPNTDASWESSHGLASLPNYLDLDSDNDEIDDLTEGYSTVGLIIPTIITDSDGDGILDLWDSNDGGVAIVPEDTDGDGTPDYLDSDSDNDGKKDAVEGNDLNQDNIADDLKSNTDANGNGIDDAVDNNCSSGSTTYACGTDIALQDTYSSGEKDWRIDIGIGDFFYYVSDNDDELFTINRITGACSSIGLTGRTSIEAIANWPARNNQVLYAADAGDFGTLNTTTGTFTLIQDVDVDGPAEGAEGSQSLSDIDGLTIDPRTGTMWASHRRSGTYDLLFQIDKTTGKYIKDAFGSGVDYIVIAGTGVYEDFDDMAVSPADGKLYGVSNNGTQDQILEINKTTGAVSVVSSLSSISDVEGLGFSNDNHMYGTSGTADDFAEIFWTTGASNTISSNMCGGGDPESLAALVENANYISGRVYHDVNQNQVDDSETGLSGVVVELYYDVNGNGAVDAGDEFLTTATTDGNGDYYFDYASVGDLVMQIDLSTLPSGYALTTNNVEAASFASQDNADTGNDFGADTGSDCDGNGIPDFTEGTADSDGDGISNQCDLDNDNDGILDSEEGIGDFDGDGIPNYLDLDSDNDGIPDAIEANGGSAPSGYNSSTGRISGSDSDSDGLLNSVDNAPSTAYGAGSTSTLPRGDHDGDGNADYKDMDSDNDGILDVLEAGGTDNNGDGEIDGFSDSNSDGYYDALTSSPLPIPNTDYAWENTYGLTILPNYLDLDSDNDEIDDLTEGYSTVDLTYPSITTDTDGDGILDLWDINSGGSPISPEDTDGDLMPDYVDDDTDDDAIPDFIEGNDIDQDFVPDIAKSNTDNNGNGIDDAVDNYCSGVSTVNVLSTDYAEEDNSDGDIDLNSSDLELVNDGSTHQTVGMFFGGVNIAQGASIANAYIQFQVDEVSTGSITLTIRGQDVDNASAFTSTDYNVSSRTTTSASVTWSPSDWNTVGEEGSNQRTVNISSIIQEIVDRPGWSSGNGMVLIITGPDNVNEYRRTAENDPTLVVEVSGALSYGCGTNIARQDTDTDGEKDWRDDQDDSGSLPVELISQSAEYHDGKVELTWKTLSEINNHYFIVQRSQDGENFEEIGQVAGSGTTNTAKNYKFDDNNPYKGISYYQLIQVDFDGTKNPLPIMFVEVSSPFESKVYPNPVKEMLYIQSNSEALLEVFDIAGRQVKSQPIMEGLFQMNVKEFESGVYFFTLTSGDQRTTHRVIIQ